MLNKVINGDPLFILTLNYYILKFKKNHKNLLHCINNLINLINLII